MRRALLLSLGLLIGTTAYAQRWAPPSPVHQPNGTTAPSVPEMNTSGSHLLSAGVLWVPMGNGFTGEAIAAATLNGDLYVAHYHVVNREYTRRISKWNGATWDVMAEFSENDYVIGLVTYRGQLHARGYFNDLPGVPENSHIIRWNGGVWEPVGDLGSLTPNTMLEYKGELYVGGWSGEAGGTHSIKRWDGTRWADLGTGLNATVQDTTAYVQDLAVYRGKLYVGGSFQHAGGLESPNLAAWNGETWEALPSGPNSEVYRLGTYRGELYIHGYGITKCGNVDTRHLARWNGRQWNAVGTHGDWPYITDMLEYNGMLYVTGVDKDEKGIARWNGTEWESIGAFNNGTTNFLFEHDGSLIAGGLFREHGTTVLNNITRMCNEGECGTISGSVYTDKNGDCVRNTADPGLAGRTVRIEPGPMYVTADAEGRFSQQVFPGSYTISLVPKLYWPQTCPQAPGTHSATVTSGSISANNDFASQAIPNVEDIRVSITSTRARPGRQVDYVITFENVGTAPASGALTFTYDSRLSHISSMPAPNVTGTSSLTWQFQDLAVDESRTIRTSLAVPTSMQVGVTICGYVEIEMQRKPDLLAYQDDRDSVCVETTNSYDPNDITVHPYERDESGLGPADTVLAYTVRFQNTGNDTAFKIVVMDTLSPHLDPATLRLGAASHPYTFAMNGNGILAWTFDDIMLPDSGASEPNSHGTFKYFVRLRHHLPAGTKIPNRAAIYFDYNTPVATNTVISTIATVLGVENGTEGSATLLTPNPSTGVLQINAPLRHGTEIVVSDVLGTVMMRRKVEGSSAGSLDLAGLPAGTYFVALPLESGMVMKMVRLVR